MFAIDLISSQKLERVEKSEEGFEYSVIDVPEMKLWKLMTTVSGDLTWDFPVLHPSRTNVVFILAIPSFLNYLDICLFIKKITQVSFKITFFKSLYRSAAIEFSTQEGADTFYINTLGEPFDLKHAHIRCISLFLLQITPDIGMHPIATNEECCERELTLPLCPLCFQLFDPSINFFFAFSTTDDFSVQAYFDWGESKCPVCHVIYGSLLSSQPPNETSQNEYEKNISDDDFESDALTHSTSDHTCFGCPIPNLKCQTPGCNETEKLWICMDCGHVGCGREKNQHSLNHFYETRHRFSLRFVNIWLWDYIADKTIQRIFQEKTPEANNEVLRLYRKKLLEGVTSVRNSYENELKIIRETGHEELEELSEELRKLEEEEQSLIPDYQITVELDEKINETQAEIDKKRNDPEMLRSNTLKKNKILLDKQIADNQAKIDKLCIFLDKRGDVSTDVDISYT